MPGDQDRGPFGGCGQECLEAFRSVLHPKNLPEPDGGTEGDLCGLAGGWDELIIGHKSDHCQVFEPIEPEREITAADADCQLAGFAIPRSVEQVAVVCVQRWPPGDLPGLVSCLI